MDKDQIKWQSPGRLKIRNDSAGSGYFGSSRDGGARRHLGIDIECEPGEIVYMPVNGVIDRIAKPSIGEYSGINILVEKFYVCKLFYFQPHRFVVGINSRGSHLGIAQSVSKKYNTPENIAKWKIMKDHLHFQVYDLELKKFVDPLSLILRTLDIVKQ